MSQKFGTRREQAKQETRRIIFNTAYALFEKKGYDEVTMRDLAAEAGVGLGTIFQHFKDKANLLVSVFEEEFQPYVNQAFKSVPEASLKEQLLFLVRQFFSYYAKRPHISRILIKEIYIDPKNSDQIRSHMLNDIQRLSKLFEDAKQRGELRPDIVSGDAVILWWSYYSFVLFQALQSDSFDVEEQMMIYERLQEQHYRGIESTEK
jgi:AcrR family transcriptional regulator